MLGAGLQFGRSHGDDRFYNSAKARRNNQNRQSQDDLHRAQSDVTVHSQSLSVKDKSVVSSTNREQESREGFEETPNPVATPPLVSPLCNLERFLDSIMPSVPAQYLSKQPELVKLKEEMSRINSKIKSSEKELKKKKEERKKHADEIKKLQNDLHDMTKKLDELHEKVQDSGEKLQLADSQLEIYHQIWGISVFWLKHEFFLQSVFKQVWTSCRLDLSLEEKGYLNEHQEES